MAVGAPTLEGEVIDQLFQTLKSAIDSLPAGFGLSFPPSASPFDLAQILMPADKFMVSLLTEPEATAQFLNNLTDLGIELTSKIRKKLEDTVSQNITNRGVPFAGLRLPSDSIVNLSPDLSRYAEAFGPLSSMHSANTSEVKSPSLLLAQVCEMFPRSRSVVFQVVFIGNNRDLFTRNTFSRSDRFRREHSFPECTICNRRSGRIGRIGNNLQNLLNSLLVRIGKPLIRCRKRLRH